MDTQGWGKTCDSRSPEGTSPAAGAIHDITPPADTATVALSATEELLTRLVAAFPGWEIWEHVGRTGWYARYPRSSPPMVAGPVLLEDLGAAIAVLIEGRGPRPGRAPAT